MSLGHPWFQTTFFFPLDFLGDRAQEVPQLYNKVLGSRRN